MKKELVCFLRFSQQQSTKWASAGWVNRRLTKEHSSMLTSEPLVTFRLTVNQAYNFQSSQQPSTPVIHVNHSDWFSLLLLKQTVEWLIFSVVVVVETWLIFFVVVFLCCWLIFSVVVVFRCCCLIFSVVVEPNGWMALQISVKIYNGVQGNVLIHTIYIIVYIVVSSQTP